MPQISGNIVLERMKCRAWMTADFLRSRLTTNAHQFEQPARVPHSLVCLRVTAAPLIGAPQLAFNWPPLTCNIHPFDSVHGSILSNGTQKVDVACFLCC